MSPRGLALGAAIAGLGCGRAAPPALPAEVALEVPTAPAQASAARQSSGASPGIHGGPARPPPGVAWFPSRDDGGAASGPPASASMACGDHTVERTDHEGLRGHLVVRGPGGGVVIDARPRDSSESYDGSFCVDLDGDGTPELAYTRWSGGAHCCRTTIVVSLGPRPRTLLRWEGGSAGVLLPVDLGRRPAARASEVALVGGEDALAEIADVPFASTPTLPLVLALDDGRFTPHTADYPALLSEERARGERALAGCDGDAICQTAWGEQLAGVALLLGDWPAARARLSLPPGVARTVDAAATKLRALLRRRGERLP